MLRAIVSVLSGLLLMVVLVGRADAQQASGIAGTVRDTSGGVLPGVTVEASSPALIEKVRVVVSDTEGRYNIVDLRPGTYVVTYTLQGFSTFRREGIVLTAGFTATVNADMQVGAVEETITVTGETPLVDTQNVRRQLLVSEEALSVLPVSNKHYNMLVTLTPGLAGMADVAGSYTTQIGEGFHGKTGTRMQIDGMGVQNLAGTGNFSYQLNAAVIQEITVQTGGISAESHADGMLVNIIPKEGSNVFSGSLSGVYTTGSFAGDNLSSALRDRGLERGSELLEIYDAGVAVGGPIKRDRLWLFTAHREWGNSRLFAGVYWNKTQGTPFYTPDLDRPADSHQWFESHALRMTWQAAERHKVNVFADVQDACVCRTYTPNNRGQAPEALNAYHFRPTGVYQTSWSAPMTNRLLLDGALSFAINDWPQFRAPGVEAGHISILEQSTGMRYNSRITTDDPNEQRRYSQRFSVAYVTGSHAFKFGLYHEQARLLQYRTTNDSHVAYTFNNRVPVSLTQYATPYTLGSNMKADLSVFAQDQWAIRRLTLNVGARFEYFNAYVPAQTIPAHPFGWLPERRFDRVNGVPSWTDLNPRLGAAYDVYDDGRMALKFSIGRYTRKTGVDIAGQNNPIVTSVNEVTRAWNDVNRNYVPDCDLRNAAANGECGPYQNQNFGQTRITTRYADEVLKGFGVRPYNWDLTAEVQRQLGSSMSVTAGYYRNWFGNFMVTDNLAVTPGDFSPYCVSAPRDSRLPGGGGFDVCGLFDVNPAKFGQVSNLIRPASDFGEEKQVADFVGLTIDARFASGLRFGGGIDTGRILQDVCFDVDSPGVTIGTNVNLPGVATPTNVPGVGAITIPHTATTVDGRKTCRNSSPLGANTQIKLNGSYPLPGETFVSVVLQNLPGVQRLAELAVPAAEIAQSLGRPLAGNARTATVPLLAPQSEFEDRITRLDMRVSKIVRVGQRVRVQGNLDIYNVLNSSSILTLTNAYGPRWLVPTAIIEPRIFQFSADVSF
jgi:hypothetical protein